MDNDDYYPPRDYEVKPKAKRRPTHDEIILAVLFGALGIVLGATMVWLYLVGV